MTHQNPHRRRLREAPGPPPRLLDERGGPDFPERFQRLAGRSNAIDIAITRVRLTTLQLDVGALAGVTRMRVLLAEVRAPRLDAEAHEALLDPARAVTVRHLIDELGRGRLLLRAAPLGGWSPDFSVFHDARRPVAGLVGAHWLERPYPYRGPAWAVELGAPDARRAAARFDELWARSHDVTGALRRLLERAAGVADREPAPALDSGSGGH